MNCVASGFKELSEAYHWLWRIKWFVSLQHVHKCIGRGKSIKLLQQTSLSCSTILSTNCAVVCPIGIIIENVIFLLFVFPPDFLPSSSLQASTLSHHNGCRQTGGQSSCSRHFHSTVNTSKKATLHSHTSGHCVTAGLTATDRKQPENSCIIIFHCTLFKSALGRAPEILNSLHLPRLFGPCTMRNYNEVPTSRFL